jgi:hypothetical protein
MAIQKISNSMLYGLAADTKPTTYANNTLFVEQDTGKIYRWNAGGTSWDIFIGADKTETLTNKTIAAGSNTISGIVDANIGSHTSTKITITAKGQLNSSIVYTDQANTFGDFDQIIRENRLKLQNPANTFSYIIDTSAITANRTLTLPLLTATDTVAVLDLAQAFTNKTLVLSSNTINDTSAATGDIIKHNGTRYVRFAKGTSLQVLRVASGGADLEWATISSYTEAKGAVTNKSGDATTTTFTIAHGLGSAPGFYTVTPTSTDADSEFYLTVDSTNITVNYPFPPPSGTNNLTYVWRAAI